MTGVLDAYLDDLAKNGAKSSTIVTLRYRLKAITACVERDRLISAVSPTVAGQLYAARVAKVKADTHRGELSAASGMFRWCVSKGWLAVDPFATVEPQGRKARRKAHLRIDEARAFRDAALADATSAGLAAAMALLMGMRASEVTELRVRDVDDSARVVWIVDAKTEAGDRKLETPPELRRRLSRLTKDRDGDERLFGEVDRHWLGYHVRRICELAGVRTVSPHALRRTWSAIGAESLPIDAVSRALGHASSTVTRRHYQPGNAEERRRGRNVAHALESR